jgi:hypothetical protein
MKKVIHDGHGNCIHCHDDLILTPHGNFFCSNPHCRDFIGPVDATAYFTDKLPMPPKDTKK